MLEIRFIYSTPATNKAESFTYIHARFRVYMHIDIRGNSWAQFSLYMEITSEFYNFALLGHVLICEPHLSYVNMKICVFAAR